MPVGLRLAGAGNDLWFRRVPCFAAGTVANKVQRYILRGPAP